MYKDYHNEQKINIIPKDENYCGNITSIKK